MQNKYKKNGIILFDGVCNFCNSSVNFIIKHDKKNYFLFAPLQSEFAKNICEKINVDSEELTTMVLIEGNKIFTKSNAALRITRKLNRAYPLFYGFIIVPLFIRNIIYDYFAHNRYKWFGKKETCMIPDDKLKEKFISF